MKPHNRCLVFLLIALLLVACDRSSLEHAGIVDRVVRPVVVKVVVDGSEGSPLSPTVFDQTVGVVLREASVRSGGVVELWAIGSSVSETRLLGHQAVLPPINETQGAITAAQQRFITSSSAYFSSLAGTLFEQVPATRSPIAESLHRVVMDAPRDRDLVVVVVSDLRETGTPFGAVKGARSSDFECGPDLPSPDDFVASLNAHGVLVPGTFPKGSVVYLTCVAPTRIAKNRCPATIERTTAIRALWVRALTNAGARVVVSAGPLASF